MTVHQAPAQHVPFDIVDADTLRLAAADPVSATPLAQLTRQPSQYGRLGCSGSRTPSDNDPGHARCRGWGVPQDPPGEDSRIATSDGAASWPSRRAAPASAGPTRKWNTAMPPTRIWDADTKSGFLQNLSSVHTQNGSSQYRYWASDNIQWPSRRPVRWTRYLPQPRSRGRGWASQRRCPRSASVRVPSLVVVV